MWVGCKARCRRHVTFEFACVILFFSIHCLNDILSTLYAKLFTPNRRCLTRGETLRSRVARGIFHTVILFRSTTKKEKEKKNLI